jgi:ankyrin repeat protein
MRRTAVLFSAALLIAAAPEIDSLFEAAGTDDLDTALRLLDQGADVNAAQGDGMTPLHRTAETGNVRMADVLIEAGANLEAQTRVGSHTPLHVASASGRAGVVALLVASGADVEARTTTGATPLHFAAASGSAGAVTALLEGGASPDPREPVWGQTPLMFAAAEGRTEVVEALLEKGANPALVGTVVDVIARDKADRAERRARNERVAASRESAGMAAAKLKEREEAEKRGNEPEPLNYAGQVGSQGGLTPLLLAARNGHLETALALLKGGANINQVSEGTGVSPMLIATINGYFDLAMILFEKGADPKIASAAGDTPLHAALNMHWAPKARHPQPVAYMQQKTSYLEMMERLLKAGADPNARLTNTLWYTTYNRDLLGVDRTGATPFWRAAYALDIEAMRLLLRYGADPSLPTIKVPERVDEEAGGAGDGKDHSGLPEIPFGGPAVYPIHAASGVGYGQGFAGNSHRHVPGGWLPAVKFLVEELGADVNARDHNGYTPLHHAAARGDNELILYLISKGADPTAVARSGQTTADMANGPVQRIQPFPETVALLEKLGSKNNHRCMSC